MANRGLGRGLSSLIPGADDLPAGGAADVPVARIRPNPYQPRRSFDAETLEELAASIRSQGVIQPLVLRVVGDGYEIITGERRWRAAQRAGLTSVPAVVRGAGDTEMLTMALVENVQREDLNPIDRALAYRRLIDELGVSQEALAQAVGRSRTSISNTLRLLRLPPEIQDRIASGHLTEGHGRALLSVANEAERHMIWRRVERDGLSVREAEELVRRATERPREPDERTPRGPRRPPELAPFLEEIENSLRTAMGTEVEISHTRTGAGLIKIRYYSPEDLERISRLMVTLASVPSAAELGLTDVG